MQRQAASSLRPEAWPQTQPDPGLHLWCLGCGHEQSDAHVHSISSGLPGVKSLAGTACNATPQSLKQRQTRAAQ